MFSREGNIWSLDLPRNIATQLTSGDASDNSPVWSPDGQRIAFTRHMANRESQIVTIGSAGGNETIRIAKDAPTSFILDDWSPDGRFLTYNEDPSLMALPMQGDPKPFPFVQTKSANLDESHFSPDSKWIAYNSNDSGEWQVYLAPWPTTGDRWQISADGGAEVRWRGDGKELYYLALDGHMMAVDVTLAARPTLGTPRRLFQSGILVDPRPDQYAVSADGQKFLLRRQTPTTGRAPLTVVVNWRRMLDEALR